MVSIIGPYLENKLNESNGTDYIIYCDLDGVLVDFDYGAKKIKEETGIDVEKDMDAFWKYIIHTGKEKWWSDLPWMKDGLDLWNYIRFYKPVILSSAGTMKSARVGKHKWVSKELGPEFSETMILVSKGEDKANYATPNTILIDDNLKYVKYFKKSGGNIVHHNSAYETIRQLKTKFGL